MENKSVSVTEYNFKSHCSQHYLLHKPLCIWSTTRSCIYRKQFYINCTLNKTSYLGSVYYKNTSKHSDPYLQPGINLILSHYYKRIKFNTKNTNFKIRINENKPENNKTSCCHLFPWDACFEGNEKQKC